MIMQLQSCEQIPVHAVVGRGLTMLDSLAHSHLKDTEQRDLITGIARLPTIQNVPRVLIVHTKGAVVWANSTRP